jgi:predicted RNase H-like HicB family nuclease
MGKAMKHKIDVIIEKDQDGFYAHCPALEGCQSQGDTFEEVCKNIQEAIALYWETLTSEEIQALLDTQIIATAVEVAVA